MKKNRSFLNILLEPCLENLIFLLIFILGVLTTIAVLTGLAGAAEPCTTGACDIAKVLPQFQINWKSADTTDGRKNLAVARMEHDDYKGRGYFTGFFIVAPNGLRANILVTAAHCFDGPGETRIYLPDGRMFKGDVLELDHIWDVAVVVVEGPNIPAMRLATVAPVRGDPISAYGYGWVGKQYARINGIALGYSIFRGQNVRNTLKCSFKVRDGDSGGPMVNSRCEVVAVISCSDDQSGTHGTWAARIKVIVDRAIARKIQESVFATTDTGKLPPPPVAKPAVAPSVRQEVARLVEARVAPPVEAGAARSDAWRKEYDLKKEKNAPRQGKKAKAPSTGLGLLGFQHLLADSDALALAFQAAAVVGGLGLIGGVGWGGWVAQRALLALYRRRKGKSVDSSADSFSFLPREAKEAQQLLQLSELEGRSPLFDALIGRLALDELDDVIDGDRPEKDYAVQLKERILSRFNEIAPVSVKKGEEK